MHTPSGDRLNHVIGFLAIGKHEEDGRHATHVLNIGAQKQQMVGNAEEFPPS